jgi:hypothetical protein
MYYQVIVHHTLATGMKYKLFATEDAPTSLEVRRTCPDWAFHGSHAAAFLVDLMSRFPLKDGFSFTVMRYHWDYTADCPPKHQELLSMMQMLSYLYEQSAAQEAGFGYVLLPSDDRQIGSRHMANSRMEEMWTATCEDAARDSTWISDHRRRDLRDKILAGGQG